VTPALEPAAQTRKLSGPFQGLAVVAFLDLLGFSARLEETWGREDSILPILFDLKELIKTNRPSMVVIRDLPEPKVLVRTISDSIVICCPIQSPDGRFAISAITSVLLCALILMGEAAKRGFGIRGGVEIGQLYYDEDEIIGPAFGRAYSIESKIAKKARVLMGPGFLEYLANNPSDFWVSVGDVLCWTPEGYYGLAGDTTIVDHLKAVRASCPTEVLAAKYDEFISQCENPSSVGRQSRAVWLTGAERIRHALNPPEIPPIDRGLGEAGRNAKPRKRRRRRR